MQELALGSVFIFQKRGIGLDNYKSKESLSRVVQQLLIRMTLDLVKAQLLVQVKLLIA